MQHALLLDHSWPSGRGILLPVLPVHFRVVNSMLQVPSAFPWTLAQTAPGQQSGCPLDQLKPMSSWRLTGER